MLLRLALAVALALVGATAVAQDDARISIVEFGLYTAEVVSTERMPSGIERNTLRNICHVETTSTVPARLGVMFGYRFQVEGEPLGEVVQLTRVTRYPVPVKPSGSNKVSTTFDHDIAVRIGSVSYIGYGFDHAWELQPGPWVLELWYGQKKLAEHTFEVVDRGERSLSPPSSARPSLPPSSSDSNCFQLSSL